MTPWVGLGLCYKRCCVCWQCGFPDFVFGHAIFTVSIYHVWHLIPWTSDIPRPLQVWTPDHSGGREGLGNKILLRSVLLECHGYLFLKLCFQIFNESVRYYSNFQNFHVLPYIQTLVSLYAHFPPYQYQQHSSAQDTSTRGFSPDPSLPFFSQLEESGVQTIICCLRNKIIHKFHSASNEHCGGR